jgi:hypothetical protein
VAGALAQHERVVLAAAGYAHSILVTEQEKVRTSGSFYSTCTPPPSPSAAHSLSPAPGGGGLGAEEGGGVGERRFVQGGGISKVAGINLYSPPGCTVDVRTPPGEIERQRSQILYIVTFIRNSLTFQNLSLFSGSCFAGLWPI